MSIRRITSLIEELSKKNDKQVIIEVNDDKEVIEQVLISLEELGYYWSNGRELPTQWKKIYELNTKSIIAKKSRTKIIFRDNAMYSKCLPDIKYNTLKEIIDEEKDRDVLDVLLEDILYKAQGNNEEDNFIDEYKYLLEEGLHETQVLKYIKDKAEDVGYKTYNYKHFNVGDKLIFEFRDKLIALVEVGEDISEGANLIVSHIDSPRLDVIVGEPFVSNDDGTFIKTQPYGGIIPQLWLDRPFVMVGKIKVDNEIKYINTGEKGYLFSITSLLPHLRGRKEVKDLSYDKLLVRMINGNKEELFEMLEKEYGITKENFELADLSFVPYFRTLEMGLDKDLLMGYGHDDRSCAYAELEAILTSKPNKRTKIALFTAYEETGSGQMSGAETQFIDDIFLTLANGHTLLTREFMRNTKVISADVTGGFDSNYSSHFEDSAKAICGNGVALVPFTGLKRGNDASIEMREYIKGLCVDNDVKYQVDTTKVSESGGGTVAMFFGIRGMETMDCGVPTASMHSPMEIISKRDLIETYKLYKVFYES